MRYQIRGTDSPDTFRLVDLKDNHRVAYRGPFRWTVAMSQLLNFEQMRLDGEIGGSVPQIDKLWPRDWRHPHIPMPLKGSVPNVLRH